MAFTPPTGINLEHLLQMISQFTKPAPPRRPRTTIASQLRTRTSSPKARLVSQVGVSPTQRTMPAAVLFARGPGNRAATTGDSMAPTNAGAVAAGTAAPVYPPNATQTGGTVQGVSPLLQALLRSGKAGL